MSKNYQSSYKEYCRPFLKRYKNTTVIPTINAIMSEIERIALSRMEWKGVDGNGVALSRKIEEYLFYFKRCAIVDTKEVGLVVVKTIPRGLNINNEPAGYDMIIPNGVKLTPVIPRGAGLEGEIGTDNAIILTDSQLIGSGCIDGVWHWVNLYADAQISLNQQMLNQRAPLVALTKERRDEQFARVQVIDVASGLNAMVIDENYGESVKALNLDSQFNVDKINAIQHEYLTRVLDSIGVDSTQAFGKKERMIVDEAEGNDESLAMILADCLRARRNPLIGNPTAEKYGITVDISEAYRISGSLNEQDKGTDAEEDDDGSISR